MRPSVQRWMFDCSSSNTKTDPGVISDDGAGGFAISDGLSRVVDCEVSRGSGVDADGSVVDVYSWGAEDVEPEAVEPEAVEPEDVGSSDPVVISSWTSPRSAARRRRLVLGKRPCRHASKTISASVVSSMRP